MQMDIFGDAPSADDSLREHWTIFFDGAARGNPGQAGAGFVIMHGQRVIERAGFYLGTKTNNQAEYLALILGLCAAQVCIPTDQRLVICGDSQLLVRQFNGQYRVKNQQLQHLFRVACLLLDERTHTTFVHITRDKNSAADAMANLAIDKKLTIPPKYMQVLHEHRIAI